MSKICWKLAIKTPQLWIDFAHCSGVPIINFEHVNSDWVAICGAQSYPYYNSFLDPLTFADVRN